MSILLVPEKGPIEEGRDFRNAWLGAMAVWVAIGEKYLGGKYNCETGCGFNAMNESQMKAMWAMFGRPEAPLTWAERVALGTTFDRAMARWENLPLLAKAFRQVIQDAPDLVGSHCAGWADYYDELLKGKPYYAVCWYHTSCGEDLWYSDRADEDDEHERYDVARDSGHWYLFDECPKEAAL